MSARVKWEGLTELRAELRRLPAALAEEARLIVHSAAEAAGDRIRHDYPRKAGNLADHVTVEQVGSGPFGAGYIVKSTAKHAFIFEHGTQARHYLTVNGVKHLTGKMPPAHVFVRNATRSRREMYELLKEMLIEHGLRVSGDA